MKSIGTSTPVVLTGAYGRTYKTKKAAISDWSRGLDFRLESGSYCSIRDLDALKDPYSSLYLRTEQGLVEV